MQGDRRFVRLGTWGRPRGRHDAGSPQLRAWGRSLGGTEKNLTSGSASDDMSSMCTGTGEAVAFDEPLLAFRWALFLGLGLLPICGDGRIEVLLKAIGFSDKNNPL